MTKILWTIPSRPISSCTALGAPWKPDIFFRFNSEKNSKVSWVHQQISSRGKSPVLTAEVEKLFLPGGGGGGGEARMKTSSSDLANFIPFERGEHGGARLRPISFA